MLSAFSRMQQVLSTTTSASSMSAVGDQAVGHQQPGEPLGVVLVHLAPEGADEVGPGHPRKSTGTRAPRFPAVERSDARDVRGTLGVALALVPLVLVLAGCSSAERWLGRDHDHVARWLLKGAGAKVQSAMKTYLTQVGGCAKQSSPVVCLEAADRRLGDKIHVYANVLAGRPRVHVARADQTTTLNAAQTAGQQPGDPGRRPADPGQLQPGPQHVQRQLGDQTLQADVTKLAGSLGQ